ncbi:hypothetical protein OG618_28010 [Kitasatospora sp. NBC_01246]|uniref:hypothetical protein n=1 Tax=Kitasatospora sp. NBC_01246 TaxID=2903570 RepID=UPI002E2F6C30|nr:hypothetical protein [Kitasatospora sp. NBC_01246]
MSFFRRRSGEGAAAGGADGRRGFGFARRPAARPAAVPALDPAHGDEELRLMLAQAAAGDWASLRPALAAVTDGAELTWLLVALSDVAGVEEWTARAVADRPEDTPALLLSGARHVSWAWEARTGARAQYVTEEQWRLFHERLDTAEEQLFEVAEREPRWLAPWYFLQISGRGASLGPDVARYRFEAALRRDPGHLGSHKQRLQQLCAKWGGSHEEMHAFARAAMLAAPEGSPLGELVALAHLEHWLDLPDGEDHAYLTGPAVLASLQEALRRSVLHADYPRPRGWQAAFNTFAMAFSLADQPRTAHLLFEALDGAVTESPWNYLSGDPAEIFRAHRDRCAR